MIPIKIIGSSFLLFISCVLYVMIACRDEEYAPPAIRFICFLSLVGFPVGVLWWIWTL